MTQQELLICCGNIPKRKNLAALLREILCILTIYIVINSTQQQLHSTTNKLQRVLNVAARVVTGTRKFDRGLSQLLHTELHWLDVPERVKYKLSVMAHRCLSGCAPQYLATYCVPVSSIAARQHLRSAVRHQLAVPSHRLSTYGRRAFAIAGPTTWNSLPTHVVVWKAAPLLLDDYLRLICFLSTSVYSTLGVSAIMHYINRRFTYLLTKIIPYSKLTFSTNLSTIVSK